MITADYCRLMARYNRWQNRSLITAADSVSDAERWRNRGAFFGSIAATLNHVLWDDKRWIARCHGDEKTAIGIDARPEQPAEWATYKSMRAALDNTLIDWLDAVDEADIAGDLTWSVDRLAGGITRARWICLTHLFNHQTHHRGQVHAMLTACGARPEATDLPVLPQSESAAA